MDIIDFTKGILVNLFVMFGFVAVCTMGREWASRRERKVSGWPAGLLFGLMATIAMMVPVTASNGMIFDARAGVIGTGAILGGPLVAVLSLPLPIAYRLHIAGGGLVPGLMEIILPAILGSTCHYVLRRRQSRITMRNGVVCGLSVVPSQTPSSSCALSHTCTIHHYRAAASRPS